MKPIETVYKGYRFRSRLEARWAIFFDALGIEWEYEPEGFELDDGTYYLPDFKITSPVRTRYPSPDTIPYIWVEVKGVSYGEDITDYNWHKIEQFAGEAHAENGGLKNPIVVLGSIPRPDQVERFYDDYLQNYVCVDGDSFGFTLGAVRPGELCFFGADQEYQPRYGYGPTKKAFNLARQARFEYGETPTVNPNEVWRGFKIENPDISERVTEDRQIIAKALSGLSMNLAAKACKVMSQPTKSLELEDTRYTLVRTISCLKRLNQCETESDIQDLENSDDWKYMTGAA